MGSGFRGNYMTSEDFSNSFLVQEYFSFVRSEFFSLPRATWDSDSET